MLLFVSDLHLGNPLFNRTKELTHLFNLDIVEEIYLIGDVFDSWESDPLNIFYEHETLITTLNFIKKPVYILMGNHDPARSFMEEVFFNRVIYDKIEKTLFGKKTIITHGHECDTDIDYAKKLFFLTYMSQRLFKLNLKDLSREILGKIKGLFTDNPLTLKMERNIYNRYKHHNFDMVISGHTHAPKIVKGVDFTYANCGCIIYKPTYILMDANNLILEEL